MFTDTVEFILTRCGRTVRSAVTAQVIDDGVADPLDDSLVQGAIHEITVFVKAAAWRPLAKTEPRVGDILSHRGQSYRIAAVNILGPAIHSIKARSCQ